MLDLGDYSPVAADAADRATRPSLLLRMRDPRDAETWRAFVATYGPLIYRHCRGRGLQDADAAELTQEVLMQVSQSIHGFHYRPEVGRFRNWLGVVTRHKVYRFFKARAGRSGVGGEAGPLDALPSRGDDAAWADDFDAHLFQTALARARPGFEAATWRAFELVWLEDRPAAEVARALGQTIGWVYQSKSRVLKRLREEVTHLSHDSLRWLTHRARDR